MPFESRLVYNAGVIKRGEEYIMVFRSDYGWDPEKKKADQFELGLARSDDGIAWAVHSKPVLKGDGQEIRGVYDPRISPVEGRMFVTAAQFTAHGYRGAVYETENFEEYELISATVPDNRNIVLFPEKIDNMYVRLERPFPIQSRDNRERFDIWISRSPDLVYWGDSQPLLTVEQIPYANIKVGAGSPPIKTEQGWLVLFHAVDEDKSRGKNGWEDEWLRRYTVGSLLLDLDDPARILGVSQQPIMVPEMPYETSEGFRYNVLFPGALIPDQDGSAKIYYGAADTCQCMAFCTVENLLATCDPI